MKTQTFLTRPLLLLCALIATTLSVVAQKQAQVWGIPFGSSKQTVTEKMLAKPATISDENDKTIYWKPEAEFAGFTTSLVGTTFNHKDELCTATFFLVPSSGETIFEQYANVRRLFEKKYGEPEMAYSYFDKPYRAGDGREVQAIRDGKCNFVSSWKVYYGEEVLKIMVMISNTYDVFVKYDYEKQPRKRTQAEEQLQILDI